MMIGISSFVMSFRRRADAIASPTRLSRLILGVLLVSFAGTVGGCDKRPAPVAIASTAQAVTSAPTVYTNASNFNGTAISAGNTLWFTSVFKVNGLPTNAVVHLVVSGSSIQFTANHVAYNLPVPDGVVTIDPSATTASTTFDAKGRWQTTMPSHWSGNALLNALAWTVPTNLPGGINPVTWSATFTSDTSGLSVNWQWAAAVYCQFGSSYSALHVKPTDDSHLTSNSDQAGTPEAWKTHVVGGARGGGGSNYTGSLSGTVAVTPGTTDKCQGVTCPAPTACHVQGVCDPGTGTCSNPAAADGTACNDGNGCTQTDTCQAGACVGSNPVTCTATDQCHVAGTCDPHTGVCSNPAAADGTACSDGNACTQTDTCQAGACVGGNPVTCTASDQCHVAGTCDPATGQCSNPAVADGAACTDGNGCTQTDTCQAGACVGGAPVVCGASDQCHVAGTCNPATGQCSNPNAANGTACNDGNACTQTDTCQAGACAGSNPVTCTASDQCHVAGTCDPHTGLCSNPNAANGTTCSDGNAARRPTRARPAPAPAATPSRAPRPISATSPAPATRTRDSARIRSPPTARRAATATLHADRHLPGGRLRRHQPGRLHRARSVPRRRHLRLATRDSARTQSPPTARRAATATLHADRHLPGRRLHRRQSGHLHRVRSVPRRRHLRSARGCARIPPRRTARPAATATAARRPTPARPAPAPAPIRSPAPRPISATSPARCDPATGLCSNPAAANGTACSDGNACTQTDTCQAGACTGGNPVDVHRLGSVPRRRHLRSGDRPCSNPTHANGTACSDGNGCTQTDTCQAGACTGSNPVVCTASDQCHTAGTCDPSTGRARIPSVPMARPAPSAGVHADGCKAGTCTGATRSPARRSINATSPAPAIQPPASARTRSLRMAPPVMTAMRAPGRHLSGRHLRSTDVADESFIRDDVACRPWRRTGRSSPWATSTATAARTSSRPRASARQWRWHRSRRPANRSGRPRRDRRARRLQPRRKARCCVGPGRWARCRSR